MPFNTRRIKTDADGRPVPQYFNPAADDYEVLQGEAGASRHIASGPLAKAATLTVTMAGGRVQLPNVPCREVTVIALRTNTGYIYAGGSDVSSVVYGVELGARDSMTFAVSNANQVWIDASVSGEGISYVAI